MKTLLTILIIISALLLALDLFIWAAANGSGHTIPAATNGSFALTALLFAGVLSALIFISQKRKRT